MEKKLKAITFSYDDGNVADRKLVELLNKYHLKGTFNLNSSNFGNGWTIDHDEVKSLYQGHEVAGHTLTHPNLTELGEKGIVWQIEQDRKVLSELVGYEVKGFAYPYSAYDDRVVGVLEYKTGLNYARTVCSTYGFSVQKDLLRYHPSVYQGEINKMFALAEEFLKLQPTEPQVFYVWGHSYEFDRDDCPINWEIFEKFCAFIADKEDIFYGTNQEIIDLYR